MHTKKGGTTSADCGRGSPFELRAVKIFLKKFLGIFSLKNSTKNSTKNFLHNFFLSNAGKNFLKKFLSFSMCFFVFLVCCFVGPSPSPYILKAESTAFGDTIPPFPSEFNNYDYAVIRYMPVSNTYDLLMCDKRCEVGFNYSYGGKTYDCALIFPRGSHVVSYKWQPLSSDNFVFSWDTVLGGGMYVVVNDTENTTEAGFREQFIYFNYNVYDTNGKLFFGVTPLMNSTIMQRSISAFLQRIYPQQITIIIPLLVVLLGLLVVSLKVCPRLLKTFTKV